MSYGSRLLHELTVMRGTAGTSDEYNQPSVTFASVGTVRALPQPKTIQEQALISQAGAVVGDWTIFTEIADIRESDRLVHNAATCPMRSIADLPSGTFQPTGVRNAAGIGHHLEIDASLIAPTPAEAS